MCSIAGIINDDITQLVTSQTHRGPDASGVSLVDAEHSLWFGHSRLSIIDLSENGSQPMESDRYALTFNGEIYNYKELAYYLSPHDDIAATLPGDTRTLLNYITRFGLKRTLDDLNGMYAFALYDKIYRKVHLVVDRLAQKPLYYTESPFAFASSPAALLHLKDKWRISEAGLQSYWKLGSVMEHSIWEGIKKVDGSEILTYDLDKNTFTRECYWRPKFQENTAGIEDLIFDAIRKVKVSDVPVYLFLSGGVDSTLVASQCEGMNAIHLKGHEQKYAEQVAKRFNLNLHVVDPAEVCASCGIKDYSRKSGESSMSGIIPWITARETHKFCKVAISANGADELFGGYDRTNDKILPSQVNHIFRANIFNGAYKYLASAPIDERLSQGRWLELQTYVKHDLNKTLDFGSMAHSLEVRNPFLDHRLVETALSIPLDKTPKKLILKNMLRKMGFDNSFVERPKLGFSLYREPKGYKDYQDKAYRWAIDNKFLKITSKPNPRDLQYLRASAAGFMGWFEVWENKIEL